jgi:multiple sugar transport system substrate-binding protein
VNHPSNPGCQFFDPETMKAQVDNPGWIRAVKEYVEILRFNPPGAISHDIVKVRDVFVSGRAALSLDWGDTAQIAADPRVSKVKDKVGYFVLPGSREIWNIRTGRWDKLPFVHKAPFLAFGGWVASVPKTSRNKDAAWDYIMWYASPEHSLEDVVTSGSGINPYRYSHFSAIDKWTEAFSARAASEFLTVLKDSLDSPHAALDLRIPGFNDYTEAFEIELTKALKGETTVEDAMGRVAEQWEGITDRLGREKQRAIYRSSMGLSN